MIDLRPNIYVVCEGFILSVSRDLRERLILLVLLFPWYVRAKKDGEKAGQITQRT